jgi:HPr kinase/phosphorylase
MPSSSPFSVRDLLEENRHNRNRLKLVPLAGEQGLERPVRRIELNRPGLALAGFFRNFAQERIQVFGRGEFSYLRTLTPARTEAFLKVFFRRPVPLCVFTHGARPSARFIREAVRHRVPVYSSRLETSPFIMLLTQTLESRLAPCAVLHGGLIEVFGVGVLITGESGIGKSETALELVKRGHRLVADDVVRVRRVAGDILLGTSDDLLRYKVEIRGLGIVDIERVFGVGSVKKLKRIDLAVKLEDWSNRKAYDRLGLRIHTRTVLGVRLPEVLMPVKAGRNIPVIIETAAMNKRLRDMGENAGRELTVAVRKNLRRAT